MIHLIGAARFGSPPRAGRAGPEAAPATPAARAADTLSLGAGLRAGAAGTRIVLDDVRGRYIKDPAFADGGRPIGGQRWMVFGDLRGFWLKGFELVDGGLRFRKGELALRIEGLPGNLDGRWAPELVVRGDQVMLFYAAGEMPPGGLRWETFRLHVATLPLAEFVRQAASGSGVTMRERGPLFEDQLTFGGDPSFAMIDPQLHSRPDGRAFLTYTVVTHGIRGVRPHQEFVRVREVDPRDPSRAIGPDRPLLDGWAGGPHDGVAEAQEIVTIAGRPWLIVSSRAGDADQRVLAAPLSSDFRQVRDEELRPLLLPGGAEWRARAVGSTGTAVIDGRPYMLYQGMDASGRFSLGWAPLRS